MLAVMWIREKVTGLNLSASVSIAKLSIITYIEKVFLVCDMVPYVGFLVSVAMLRNFSHGNIHE